MSTHAGAVPHVAVAPLEAAAPQVVMAVGSVPFSRYNELQGAVQNECLQ